MLTNSKGWNRQGVEILHRWKENMRNRWWRKRCWHDFRVWYWRWHRRQRRNASLSRLRLLSQVIWLAEKTRPLAWETVVQAFSRALSIRVPQRINHLNYLGTLYHNLLLCGYSDLQRLLDARLCNYLHRPTRLLARFRRRRRHECSNVIPTTLQDAAEGKSPQFQDILRLDLDVSLSSKFCNLIHHIFVLS